MSPEALGRARCAPLDSSSVLGPRRNEAGRRIILLLLRGFLLKKNQPVKMDPTRLHQESLVFGGARGGSILTAGRVGFDLDHGDFLVVRRVGFDIWLKKTTRRLF